MTSNTHPFYILSADSIARIERAMLRLYTEDRLTGDEMRDMAHDLRIVLDDLIPYPVNYTTHDRMLDAWALLRLAAKAYADAAIADNVSDAEIFENLRWLATPAAVDIDGGAEER